MFHWSKLVLVFTISVVFVSNPSFSSDCANNREINEIPAPAGFGSGQCDSEGNRTGHWVIVYQNGGIAEGSYVNGKRHGTWKVDFPGDAASPPNVSEGQYVKGEMKGVWKTKYADGSEDRMLIKRQFIKKGKVVIEQVSYLPDGSTLEGYTIGGRAVGLWLMKDSNGKLIKEIDWGKGLLPKVRAPRGSAKPSSDSKERVTF